LHTQGEVTVGIDELRNRELLYKLEGATFPQSRQ